MNYEIIQYVYLTDKHLSTFRTIHKIGNKLIDKPYKLQIIKYINYEGFYLIQLDIKLKGIVVFLVKINCQVIKIIINCKI